MITIGVGAGFILSIAASRLLLHAHSAPEVGLGLAIGLAALALFGMLFAVPSEGVAVSAFCRRRSIIADFAWSRTRRRAIFLISLAIYESVAPKAGFPDGIPRPVACRDKRGAASISDAQTVRQPLVGVLALEHVCAAREARPRQPTDGTVSI